MEDGIEISLMPLFFMQFFPMFAILERVGKDMEVRYALILFQTVCPEIGESFT